MIKTEVKKEQATSSESFLKRLLSRALTYTNTHDASTTNLKECTLDLVKLAGVEPSLKGCGLFSSQLLHCQLLVNKVSRSWVGVVDGRGF